MPLDNVSNGILAVNGFIQCLLGIEECPILPIPNTVQIVTHEIDPINIFYHTGKIEPAKIPVGARNCKGDAVLPTTRRRKGFSQGFQK